MSALRLAGKKDVAALAALERECLPRPWTREQLLGELAHPTSFAFLALAGGGTDERAGDAPPHAVAYALFRRLVDEGELLRVAVARAWRRRGIAAALVERGLDQLRSAGCRVAFLEVHAGSTGAILFYQHTGWQSMGRRPRYYDDGVDALLFRRDIAGQRDSPPPS